MRGHKGVGKTQVWIKGVTAEPQAIPEEMEMPSGKEDVLKEKNAGGPEPMGGGQGKPLLIFPSAHNLMPNTTLKSCKKEQVKTTTALSIILTCYFCDKYILA